MMVSKMCNLKNILKTRIADKYHQKTPVLNPWQIELWLPQGTSFPRINIIYKLIGSIPIDNKPSFLPRDSSSYSLREIPLQRAGPFITCEGDKGRVGL